MRDDKFNKIVLLDAARKYFTAAQIKGYIEDMAKMGLDQLQLYLSDNQGFRFALDDMVITTRSGKVYDLSLCLGKGYTQKDKNMYPHESDGVLSQSEMDEIITYANERGIEIVPCLNSPGHMGTILEQYPEFRYTDGDKTSKSSINLINEEAVEFALAFVEKYIKYFREKGTSFFCLGADEYANDVEGMGFEGLIKAGYYNRFVAYLNKAAQIVIDEGMTPRIFNDGAYYAEMTDSQYRLNKAIQVYYWDCYDRAASVKTITEQGHQVINANKNLYYVVAHNPWICVTKEVVENFDKTTFADGEKVENPIGVMLSVWCDDGRDETMTSEVIIENTLPIVKVFGKP